MNNNLESEQPMLGKSCLFYDIYYIVHLKCINYPRADILNKKKMSIPLLDQSWPNKRLGYKYF